jgi:hypothetical protein
MNFFFVKQLPVLRPSMYHQSDLDFVAPRILELVYTSYDLKSFAEQMEYQGEPFKWNEDRRAVLRAELDAYFARLYGLNRKQLRYILDPADLTARELEDILDPWEEVADPLDPTGYAQGAAASDFPGETFRVLKEKEIKQYGEYRTRRLVLEAWERLERGELGVVNGEEARPAPAIEVNRPPVPPEPLRPKPVAKEEEQPQTPLQPALSDFGLYKCSVCGKMVMGYEKGNHEQEVHGGKNVEWRKIR